MTKLTILAVAVMLLAPAAAVVLADTATTAPTTATAPAASGPATTTSAPTTEPASMPATTPVVIVGDKVITVGDVNTVLANALRGRPAPAPELRGRIISDIIEKMMVRELQHVFVASHKLQPDEKELAKTIEEITQEAAKANLSKEELLAEGSSTMADVQDQLALRNSIAQASTDEKAKAYVEAHPSYFDGTELRVSHIVILSSPLDATVDQLAARQKLEEIAKQINDGKISFAEAAKANSMDDTKDAGGDLGTVKFDLSVMKTGQGMDPGFILACFNTEKGKVSPVFRTQFGWHIVQITEVKPGTGKPAEGAQDVAKQALIAEHTARILTMPLKEAIIVYPNRPTTTTASAPASQPATTTATAPVTTTAKAPTTAPAEK